MHGQKSHQITSLHVSSNSVLIIRRINCINTSSGMYHLHTRQSSAQIHITDDVLIQLIILMMSTGLLETCREVK